MESKNKVQLSQRAFTHTKQPRVQSVVFRCAVLIKLLHLHPAVLEPYFNLSLGEV